jgi:acyl-CoA synthetase (AMP-forming)/AMP-acid ligase II
MTATLPLPPRTAHIPWPEDLETLVDLFAHRAETPQLQAFRLIHHGLPPEEVRWGELWTAARAHAAQLRAAGLRTGDRVMMIFPTCREFLEWFIGAMLAGGVPVPAAPPISMREAPLAIHHALLGGIARDSAAAFCVTQEKLTGVVGAPLAGAAPGMRVIAGLAGSPDDPLLPLGELHRPHSGDTAFCQYTSGSTSAPKGIELTHRNLLSNIAGIWELVGTDDAIGVSWLPLYHDMGLIGAVLAPMTMGRQITVMPPQAFVRSPVSWLRAISDVRATATVAPNFAFALSVKAVRTEQMEGVRLDSLRVALNGAEPVDPDAVRQFEEKFAPYGLRRGTVRPVYGLAESSLAVSFADPGAFITDTIDSELLESARVASPARSAARSRSFISVGRAIPGSEIEIFDDDGRPLPERRIGEIVVRGPSVMKGYANQPEETARVLAGGYLHTGDLGYIAEGQLFITGRSKDLIIRYGRNYYPNDIEAEVAQVGDVMKGSCAAFSIEEGGSVTVVIVAETRETDPAAMESLTMRIKERISDAFLFTPDNVVLVPRGAIPRTTSGKVRRNECRRAFLSGR